MSLKVIEHSDTYLLAEISATPESIAYLRNILLFEVPGIRFNFLSVQDNTTIFSDEILLARFMQVPLWVKDTSILPFPGPTPSLVDTLEYDVNVFGIDNNSVMTSSDIIPRVPNEVKIAPRQKIVPMRNGQVLNAVLFAQKGIGINFSPVYLVNNRIKMKIISPVSTEARESCKYGVFDIEDFPTDIIPDPSSYDIYKCVRCGECTKRGVIMKSDVYILEIRTSGTDPENALKTALSILRSKGLELGSL